MNGGDDMAYCKICNTITPGEADVCDECNKKLLMDDELYLDRLLASVTESQNSMLNQTLNLVNTEQDEENKSKWLTDEQLERQSSNDDDWNLLNQTMKKNTDGSTDINVYHKDIPSEGALDEVESILEDDYGSVLQELANPSEQDYDDSFLSNHTLPEYEDIMDDLLLVENMENQDDIMSFPDHMVEEDAENFLVNHEVFDSLDENLSGLDDKPYSLENIISKTDDVVLDEDTFLSSILENNIQEPEIQETYELEKESSDLNMDTSDLAEELSLSETLNEEYDNSINEKVSMDIDFVVPDFISEEVVTANSDIVSIDTVEEASNNESVDSKSAVEVNDELFEIDQLLGEVTNIADEFSLENIMSVGVMHEEVEEGSSKISTSDVLSRSLGAVSSLEDTSLEDEFNSILPSQKPIEETKKVRLAKKLFSNVMPDDPESEKHRLEEEEILAQEAKQKKAEEKQQKAILKEEKKAKRAALKQTKEKNLADEKLKRKKAREAIAASYVPEGKINRAGAFIVFVMAACLAFVIIKGTSFASYHLSINSAKKDFGNSRFDEAYETLSGEKLNEKDEIVYDKLQTIMVVKKELNSFYNFKKINMELEALNSIIKGLDRYERYYANAKELEVDKELNALKKEIVSILQENYSLSEKDTIKLIAIQDDKLYTEQLNNIVAKIKAFNEDAKQVANKN